MIQHRRIVLIALLVVAFLIGCTKEVRYSPEEIKDFPPEVQEQIRSGTIAFGMTPQQVRFTWGNPSAVNVLAPSPDGKPREEWLYYKVGMVLDKRLLFVDGKLVDIFPEPK